MLQTAAVRDQPTRRWFDLLLALRDRLLASPRFRRWATAFPFTRPIARRRARALFDLCAGFVYSQVLLACVRLKLFEILAAGPLTVAELAPRLSLSEDATLRLLRAAAALRLLERRGAGRYGLGPLGAALIDNPGITAMIEHHVLLYADLHDPVALLRGEHAGTELGRYWAYAGRAYAGRAYAGRAYAGRDSADALNDAQIAAYTELMAASQPLVAAEVLDAYRFARHRCLLDVGGGNGAFLSAVATRYPELRLMLFDLPAVAEQARARFAREGLTGRVGVTGGDLYTDPLPSGADLISLVRVVHDHGDDAALELLRAVHRALPAGGVLLVAEPLADTPGAEPIGDAYFGFYLLAMGQGRPRTPAELETLLQRAGFRNCRLLATRTPMLTRVLVAEKNDTIDVNLT